MSWLRSEQNNISTRASCHLTTWTPLWSGMVVPNLVHVITGYWNTDQLSGCEVGQSTRASASELCI